MSLDTGTETRSIDSSPLVDTQTVLLAAQEVFGRKWNPIILHRLLVGGPMRFNELQRSIDDISGKMLSKSLEHLEDQEVVDRRIVSERPVQVEYTLTDRGAALAPAIRTFVGWGREYLPDVERAVAGPSRR